MHFERTQELEGVHQARVKWLEFSPISPHLASGDDAGLLVVWDIRTGQAITTLGLKGGISVIAWDQNKRDRLFAGLDKGDVLVIDSFKTPYHSAKTGVIGAPVHAITTSSNGRLAWAIGSEVHIACEMRGGSWVTVDILPAPVLHGNRQITDQPIRPRSLHFHKRSSQLIVSYLYHGIVCWDLSTSIQLWDIPPTTSQPTIGYSVTLPDISTLVISDMATGAVAYSLKDRKVVGKLNLQLQGERNVPIVVAALRGTSRAICGNHDGSVSVWDVAHDEMSQRLHHAADGLVQCVAAQTYIDEEFLASTVVKDKPVIKIWKSRRGLSMYQIVIYRYEGYFEASVVFIIVISLLGLTLAWLLYSHEGFLAGTCDYGHSFVQWVGEILHRHIASPAEAFLGTVSLKMKAKLRQWLNIEEAIGDKVGEAIEAIEEVAKEVAKAKRKTRWGKDIFDM
ncbi:hypothetical protein D9611_010066 [Ephemerocybe angulata]|uniref:WD40 repeat-like protein n=1 Tax=Ephemerocybe angulata TaxID=980116 RepID=A0A8H5B0S2_9AGAR|nr:hypothetical protein D9611_010066 [Tulosesus angulatus]